MIKVVIYKEPYAVLSHPVHCSKIRKFLADYVPSERSLKRTRQTIKDIVLCNDFDLFVTFTFDPKKHDRYNANHCKLVMTKWLSHQRVNFPDMKYLLVPELHKDGAIHFHALMSGFNGSMRDSGHKVGGRTIFNVTCFRAGFSTAVRIEDQVPVANYIRKYITKDMSILYGRKRYFCSNNLKRPESIVNSSLFRDTPPLFRHQTGTTEYCEFYDLDLV